MSTVPLGLSLALFLGGCTVGGPPDGVVISPLFDVCMELPSGAEYVLDTSAPVDFDEGLLRVGAETFNVYVGHNPDFSKHGRDASLDEGAFALIGSLSEGSRNKALFAQRRGAAEVVYVMLDAHAPSGNQVAREMVFRTCRS